MARLLALCRPEKRRPRRPPQRPSRGCAAPALPLCLLRAGWDAPEGPGAHPGWARIDWFPAIQSGRGRGPWKSFKTLERTFCGHSGGTTRLFIRGLTTSPEAAYPDLHPTLPLSRPHEHPVQPHVDSAWVGNLGTSDCHCPLLDAGETRCLLLLGFHRPGTAGDRPMQRLRRDAHPWQHPSHQGGGQGIAQESPKRQSTAPRRASFAGAVASAEPWPPGRCGRLTPPC